MRPVKQVRGRMMPLPRNDVDTDQIMPKQFLTRVERDGFGEFVFYEWRQDPSFVFNDRRFAGARILVAGHNFGSGSSREHAVWGLQQYGFDAILAPSFSDIFAGNCTQGGVVPAVVDTEVCQELQATVQADPTIELLMDVETLSLRWTGGEAPFALDSHAQEVLLNGLDDLTLILNELGSIEGYEMKRPAWVPHTPLP